MRKAYLTFIALITLLVPFTLFATASVNAEQEAFPRTADSTADSTAVTVNGTAIPQSDAEPAQAEQMFDPTELAELAELEADNPELQQQTAGFFGPRLGTIIIIGVVLVLLL